MNYKGNVLNFTRGTKIGNGGNGNIYNVKLVDKNSDEELVVKFLNNRSLNSERYERFKREVQSMILLKEEIDGIIDIIDYNIPEKLDKNNEGWYVMPKAIPIKEIILHKNLDIKVKMKIIREMAVTLNFIHKKKYAHRDIKLDNMLYYNGKYVFSDFGLVSNTEYIQITRANESIGPWNTIAPEMKRHAYDVKDARPADVYSFAKTIWIILTENEKCFDGQYDKNKVFSLKNKDFDIESIEVIHELLKNATDDNMYNRPSMDEIIQLIDKWVTVISDSNKILDENRRVIEQDIRQQYIPDKIEYKELRKIKDIVQDNSELYYLEGIEFGRVFLKRCDYSQVEKCIEINDGKSKYIIKPVRLTIINNKDDTFNYILETEDISDEELKASNCNYIRINGENFMENYFAMLDLNEENCILLSKSKINFIPYKVNI